MGISLHMEIQVLSLTGAKTPEDRVTKSASSAAIRDSVPLGTWAGNYNKIRIWTGINRKFWWEWFWNQGPHHSKVNQTVFCDHRLNYWPHSPMEAHKDRRASALFSYWPLGAPGPLDSTTYPSVMTCAEIGTHSATMTLHKPCPVQRKVTLPVLSGAGKGIL